MHVEIFDLIGEHGPINVRMSYDIPESMLKGVEVSDFLDEHCPPFINLKSFKYRVGGLAYQHECKPRWEPAAGGGYSWEE